MRKLKNSINRQQFDSHAMILESDFRNPFHNQMHMMIKSNSTILNTEFNNKEELNLYL